MASDPLDFSPPLLRLQESPPNPLGAKVLWALLLLLVGLLVWAVVGRLDIVAVAEGKLVPQSYVKIVQPSEAGIVKEILVKEGEQVRVGQVLMRMDALITEADAKSLEADYQRKRLALGRMTAELEDKPFKPQSKAPAALVREVEAQYDANRAAYEAALAEERSRLVKAKHELSATEQVRNKLIETLPHYRQQEKAYEDLLREGYVPSLMASDKRRERIEKEQELRTQEQIIESARASMQQSEKKLLQIASDYRRQLHTERNDIEGQADKLAQEVAKQAHRKSLMELRATQDGTVKDLATHTAGTVVQPGTVLLTLVPREEALSAEVWVSNEDIGFVRKGQAVKLKCVAFPFQKYGMMDGTVEQVSADAADSGAMGSSTTPAERQGRPLVYRALVALKSLHLEMNGKKFQLAAGMQTNAEIRLGDRTVLEYLLSPVKKAWHESGRER
jgi:hemolysin D